MVNTDALNSNLALLGLCLLLKHQPHCFPVCDSTTTSTGAASADQQTLQCSAGRLSRLDLTSEATRVALCARPPCRWEKHMYTPTTVSFATESSSSTTSSAAVADTTSAAVPPVEVEVEVVLDVGHNPAAVGALARRIAFEYKGRNVR